MWRPFLALLVTSYAQLPSVVVPWQRWWFHCFMRFCCSVVFSLSFVLFAQAFNFYLCSCGIWRGSGCLAGCIGCRGLHYRNLGPFWRYQHEPTLTSMNQLDPTISYSVFHQFQHTFNTHPTYIQPAYFQIHLYLVSGDSPSFTGCGGLSWLSPGDWLAECIGRCTGGTMNRWFSRQKLRGRVLVFDVLSDVKWV